MMSLSKTLSEVSQVLEKTAKQLLKFLIASYRTIGTTHLGGSCRFQPSCSEYALQALETHRVLPAFWLILKRVGKCHPGGPYGYDPVPLGEGNKNATKQ
jgi:putative membrane protein insertion efficiency factor